MGKRRTGAEAATLDVAEVARFERVADAWWDTSGPFQPLHRLNPVRIDYLRARVAAHFGRDAAAERPLAGLRVLDIGCGGGLVSEPLARLGAKVTGIDASAGAIAAARAHAKQEGLKIAYRRGEVQSLGRARFDLVVALEIVEHVADVAAFVAACAERVAPGGALALATLNRTLRSFALGIVAAEYVLGWVPRGTHDWRKFVRPAELGRALRAAGMDLTDVSGVGFSPLSGGFRLGRDAGVNYLAFAVKPAG
ncbi:MAG: bifunctional 2-polyprenyl-6-hydroxyphenol methylase/3-demethylubiquinol 3-O-methyltransferase UbiG [Alphaproteobacteria bacterium]|nr:bifunctional 2-polyprenyl-6-hydroxyphenol methylase/3-demethylubiquinol 3-O-methyltransferase UbiG [Alphaproteobacteria bacterium]